MTALYVIGIIIAIIVAICFVWYYIKEFGDAIFSGGCVNGCGCTVIIILLIIGWVIYTLST